MMNISPKRRDHRPYKSIMGIFLYRVFKFKFLSFGGKAGRKKISTLIFIMISGNSERQ